MTSISDASILIVEDEFLIALDAEAMLRDLGAARVEVAGSYEDAEARLAKDKFDVVLLDMNLNGRASLPLAELAAAKGARVIFCTGYSANSEARAGLEKRTFVTKPYTSEHLAAGLASVLAS